MVAGQGFFSIELYKFNAYNLITKDNKFMFVIFKVILWELIESSSDQSYINNIINLSGVLAGFLFTTYGIFMSLPNNRFIHLLKFNGYMGIIYKTLLFGIVFLISSMILGLFTNYYNLITYIFVFGISETITSVYHFYKVLKYSSKSK